MSSASPAPARPSVAVDPAALLPSSARRGVWAPLRWLTWIVAATLLSAVVIAPLDTWSQALFGLGAFAFCLILNPISGRWVTLTLVVISITASLRYLHWRVTTTVGNQNELDIVLSLILLGAECYAVLVLLLGYLQTANPLDRKPVVLPDDTSLWPSVDVYIPTYNEPLAVVRTTVLAAKALDWPREKLNIYLLDDGRRDEFRAFCQRAGVGYIIRPDNKHAKAGNINHALTRTKGDLIAIFDCDHIPTRSFLQLTVGWFLLDPKLVMVQTPHHFYTPDPFERNLATFKKVPNEGQLFYGVLQKGNDLWNAAFFCGSCAVIKRAPLEEVGGIAPETVTEDAHTMLKLHRRGYRSAYLDVPQAAGLATESLSSHVGQRIRWARGMAQIFRTDNPLFGRGLRLMQRLCYLSAMLHFFYGIPRLIFLLAPLCFLVFGAQIFNASAETILAFALPHMAHAYLTNARIQGAHRHSFWAEVYEATLATYITYPTTLALISPKLGKFNVTVKGGVVERDYFDLRIAAPYLVLITLNLIGIGAGIWKWVTGAAEPSSIAINIIWSGYGLMILGATLAVAWERRQRRVFPRVDAKLPAMVWLPDQKAVACETLNLSTRGLALTTPYELPIGKDDLIDLAVMIGKDEVPAQARVIQKHGRVLRLELVSMPLEAEESLVRATFSRPTAWTDWASGRRRDRPLLGLLAVLAHGVRGAARLPWALVSKKRAAIGLLAMGLGLSSGERAQAQETPLDQRVPLPPAEAPRPFVPTISWSLEHLGFNKAVRTYNRWTSMRLPFAARGDEVFTAARLVLELDRTVPLPRGLEALKIAINDEPLGRIPLADVTAPLPTTLELEVPPQLMGEKNALSLDLELSPDAACPVLVGVGTWQFLRGGRLDAAAAPLPLPSQLDMLPAPFFDPNADAVTPIHIVMPHAPGSDANGARLLRVASYVAAYFGTRGGARFAFPTHYAELPDAHAVVLLLPDAAQLVPDLGPIDGPMVAMRDNPASKAKSGKLWIIAGRNLDELELAARRVLLDFDATKGKGTNARFDFAPEVGPREPYDAPRWFPVGAPLELGVVATKQQRTFKGALGGSIGVSFRIPPDIFTWPTQYMELDLAWRSLVPAGVERPHLTVDLNGHFLANLALASDPEDALEQRATLRIPTTDLRGFNELHVHVVVSEGACPDPGLDGVEVELLGSSVLHLEGHQQFRPMPDLEAFVNDGYPFTRMADLSETTAILPRLPMPGEVATLLSFVAHATAITGHPPMGLEVMLSDHPESAGGEEHLGGKDVLIIGAVGHLSGLAGWEETMPLRGLTRAAKDGAPIQLPSVAWHRRAMAFLQGRPLREDLERLGAVLKSTAPRAYVVGLESPWMEGRSAVIVSADDAAAMPSLPAMKGYAEALQPQADVLVLANDRPATFRVFSSYATGHLGPWTRFLWFIASHWIILLPLLLVTAMVFAWVMKRRLQNLAYRRLALEVKT